MLQAYRHFIKGWLDFSGRSSRPDFWWLFFTWSLFTLPLLVTAFFTILYIGVDEIPVQILKTIAPIYVVLYICFLVPALSLTIRRLRDAGFHWAWIFLGFIPRVGALVLLVLLAMPTKESQD